MNSFIQNIEDTISFYEMLLEQYTRIEQMSPPGSLVCQKDGERYQLMQIETRDGERHRHGINQDIELQRMLAQKEFAAKAIKILKNNTESLRKALNKQVPFDPDEIIHSMGKAYSLLPEDFFFNSNTQSSALLTDESLQTKINRHKEWGNAPYKESMYHAERKNKRTSRGTYVRSKSELLIIETLYKYDIPMHYDEEQIINGKLFIPDFTFLDRDGERFFWEYMGMMNDPGYARKNLNKLYNYYSAGFIPGGNLIVTFDLDDSMNMGVIEAIVQNDIIPRL